MLLLLACSPRHIAGPPPDPPEAAALFEAHLAAIGGGDALLAHRTRRIAGTLYVDEQDIAAPFTIARAAPWDLRTTTAFPAGLTLQSGVSGPVAWARDPGARMRHGDERIAAIRRASLHREVEDAAVLERTVLEQADFHGVTAWRVAVDYAEGPDEEAWFSVSDGRLIGRTEWGDSQAAPEDVLYADWAEHDGVWMPTTETRFTEGLTLRSVVSEVAVNVPVDTTIPADLAPPHGPDIVLPLQRRGVHVVVPVSLAGGEERLFLLDTGANATVLDAAVAAELGLPEGGLEVPAGGAAGEIAGLRLVSAVPMTIGGREYPAPLVAVMDLGGLGLAGILGTDFLAWHTVDVDPAAGLLRLTDSPPDVTGLVALPAERFSAGLLRLTVTVADRPVVAMLDLGADVSVLGWRAANLAGIRYGEGERDGELMGADGRAVQLYAAPVPLRLGELDLGRPRVAIANLDALRRHFGDVPAALIGQDLLTARRVVIDYRGGMVYLGR